MRDSDEEEISSFDLNEEQQDDKYYEINEDEFFNFSDIEEGEENNSFNFDSSEIRENITESREQENTESYEYREAQSRYNERVGETIIVKIDDSNAKCRITPINGDIRNRELKKDKQREKNKKRQVINEEDIPKNYSFKKYKVDRKQIDNIKRMVVEKYYDFENNNRKGYNSSARNKWGNSRTERAISIIGNTNRTGEELKDDYRNLLAVAPKISNDNNIFYMRSQTNKEKKYPYKIVISKDGSKYSCTCPDFIIHKKANDLYIQKKSIGYVRIGYIDRLVRPMDYILICKHIRCAYIMMTINADRTKKSNNITNNNANNMSINDNNNNTNTNSNIGSTTTKIQSKINSIKNKQAQIDTKLSSIFGCYVNKEGFLTTIKDRNKWKSLPFDLNPNLSLEIYNGYYLTNNYINEISSRMNIPNDRVLFLLNNCFGYNRIERAYIIVEKLSFFIRPYAEILKKNLIEKKSFYKRIEMGINNSSSYMVYFIPEVETRSYQYWRANESKTSLNINGQVVVYSSDSLTCTCYEHSVLNIEFCTHIIAFYYFYSKGNQLGTSSIKNNSFFQGVPIDVWRYIHLMDTRNRTNNVIPVVNPIINEMMYSSLNFKENREHITNINIEEIKKLTASNSLSYYNSNWKSSNYGIKLKFSNKSLKLSHIKPLNNNN